MSLLSKAERALGRFAIPNLPLYLVVGQVAVYFAILAGQLNPAGLILVPRLVMLGQWWRLFGFLLMPPPSSIWFIAFAWWLFYLMGNALEHIWGTFKFNVFILLGSVLTVGVSFLNPDIPVTNLYLAESVFLAFAYLNPDFELSLFFIIPVRIKWFALLTWILCAVDFIRGDWVDRLQILAAVGNFLLFFGQDILLNARYRRRQMVREAASLADDRVAPARHCCRVCGKTERSNPDMDFRYCSKCAGDACYCSEHLRNHEHVTEALKDGSG